MLFLSYEGRHYREFLDTLSLIERALGSTFDQKSIIFPNISCGLGLPLGEALLLCCLRMEKLHIETPGLIVSAILRRQDFTEVNAVNGWGCTALQFAENNGHDLVYQLLVQHPECAYRGTGSKRS